MPRYYFHFQDGSCRTSDAEGTVLPDAEAAWYQGVRRARDFIDSPAASGARGISLEVEDEEGMQLWLLSLDDLLRVAA